MEVGARKAQARAINTPEFQRLDSVFKELPKLKDVSLAESLIPSVLQTTSAHV